MLTQRPSDRLFIATGLVGDRRRGHQRRRPTYLADERSIGSTFSIKEISSSFVPGNLFFESLFEVSGINFSVRVVRISKLFSALN